MMTSGSLDSLSLPYKPTSSFERYLIDNLRTSLDNANLTCHVITDSYAESDWESESLPSAFVSSTEYLKTRHLILISQYISGSPEKKKFESPFLVLGMSVIEYAARNVMMTDSQSGIATRSYIQYVDSTGLIRPRNIQGSLSRSLVQCYIRYARDILQVNCIHLFASPKPSLLFAGSEVLGKKTVNGGRHLISWWLSLLNESLSDMPMPTFVYAFGPGEELLPASARHTRQCIEKLSRRFTLPCFIYGFPYRPEDSVQDHIPTFEDDPKFRHMEALLETRHQDDRPRKRQKRDQPFLTVREFFETITYRSDFSNDHSALISVQFDQKYQSATDVHPIKRSETASCVLNMLRMLSFDSEVEVLKSSARVLALIRIVGVLGFPVKSVDDVENLPHQTNGNPKFQQRFKETFHLLQPSSHTQKQHEDRPVLQVSDLSAFIRRKLPRPCN